MITLVSLMLLAAAGAAGSPPNSCIDCHLTRHAPATEVARLQAWSHSRHAREGVTCEACHGGNPRAQTALGAHIGVEPVFGRYSPLDPANAAATCGRCHRDKEMVFNRTAHARQARRSTVFGPGCPTCHAGMAARVPAPAELEARCRGCHPGSGTIADRASVAGLQLEVLQSIGSDLARAKARLARTWHMGDRHQLGEANRRATDSYEAAVDALHAWDRYATAAALVRARQDVNALLADLGGR